MQKGLSFCLIILFTLPIILFLSSESKAQVIEEKIVVIKGTDDWKNTQIKLLPKDKVTIRATGKICFSNGHNQSCVNANGMLQNTYEANWPGDYLECEDPLPEVNHAALIGNVGSDDFLIGKNTAFSDKHGVLYIGINDCTFNDKYYNTGQFEVLIKVTHIK
jgi:hypothetical protein